MCLLFVTLPKHSASHQGIKFSILLCSGMRHDVVGGREVDVEVAAVTEGIKYDVEHFSTALRQCLGHLHLKVCLLDPAWHTLQICQNWHGMLVGNMVGFPNHSQQNVHTVPDTLYRNNWC